MKPDPSKVVPTLAKIAMENAYGDRQKAWSEYIRAMFQNTGSIVPRCDAKDFYAYIDAVVEKKS